MDVLRRGLDLTFTAFAALAGVMLVVQALVVAADAILRTVATPFSWGVEVNTYLLVAEGTLAAPWALRRGSHFRVTLLSDRLPPTVRAVVGVIGNAVAVVMLAALAWQAWLLVATSVERDLRSGTSLHTPLFLPQSGLALGLTLLALAFLLEAIDAWSGRRAPRQEDDVPAAT